MFSRMPHDQMKICRAKMVKKVDAGGQYRWEKNMREGCLASSIILVTGLS
jgi:hypothetical protein